MIPHKRREDTLSGAVDAVFRQPWFSLLLSGTRDKICLGPDLLIGLGFALAGLLPGQYAVLQRIPALRDGRLPDWGRLTVRGPGSWVLVRADGGYVHVPLRSEVRS
jgi:hypothetical protein